MRSKRMIVAILIGVTIWLVAAGGVYYGYGRFVAAVVDRAIANTEGNAFPVVEPPEIKSFDPVGGPGDFDFDLDESGAPGLGGAR